ncbi:cytochrome d ubiquinol oxidase subunit II [Kribbella speibonae]|uniref:Cytochrome d ubiquinol oxidase subunit II n=1 Tax=Kribbella speibonae TaxID=1572660 RepID=A0ABY1ZWT7_9ACTN|nr:cytochrome d ubiquinol oxidase subunit II [Kribbella speibonae]TCC16863.1 cytochrome d ubiquinol oxidase subunit II [Kribbella speibonae]
MTAIWFLLILLCLLMYVVLDGYDLGIGIATLIEPDAGYRHEMLEEVAQAWDANETWLVLLGVSLWAGFPLAFGVLLPHAYLPVIVMLFALIVRGVSVEMASQAHPAPRWERAFGGSSLIAALAQGVAVATLVSHLTLLFPGSPFGAIGWFSALSAATVTCGYLALGYAYLKWKATGRLRARAGHRGAVSAVLALLLAGACFAAVGTTDAPLSLHGPARIIAFAGLLLFAVAGVVTSVTTSRPTSSYDGLPLAGLVTAVVTLVIALVVARYPVLAPPDLTLASTASPPRTQAFLAVGVGLNVPLILFYNWFAHHAFRSTAPNHHRRDTTAGASR